MVASEHIIPAVVHRDLARAISAAENGAHGRAIAAATLPGRRRDAARLAVLGITGPPGAGKSTLVDRLIEGFRARGETVAVIAVDPSSPFTRGAVLGDRVRMQRHSGDYGVYIRSMASRESGGGLAPATREAVALIDAAGFDVCLIETVGVGQVELEIVGIADAVAVVTVPALGDSVQTIKAGMMEVADLFVVNMADRPGANATAVDLTHMLRESNRDVQVLQTVANAGTGVGAVLDALVALRQTHTTNAERSVRFDVARQVRERAALRAAGVLDSDRARAILDDVREGRTPRALAVAALLALCEPS